MAISAEFCKQWHSTLKLSDPASSAEQCAFRWISRNCFFIEMCISVVETLLFFASSLPRRGAHVHELQNTSSIFSEEEEIHVLLWIVLHFFLTSTNLQLLFPSALVKGQALSLAVPLAMPGTPAPLARCHNSDSVGTQVGKHHISLSNCLTTKSVHLVGVLQSD